MSDAIGIASVEIAPKRRSRLAEFFIRLVREKPLGTASGIIVLILILVSIFADVLAPYGYLEANLVDRLQGPSATYLIGTDQLGRDYLSRIIYGARLSLTVGLAATALSVVVAFLVGGTSGFLGGKLDMVVQRFVDGWMVFPGTAPFVKDNVRSGAGFATDNTGPGDIRRHRGLKSSQKCRYWCKRE